jgi:hypothetical protein
MGIRDTTPTACLSSELAFETISEALLRTILRFYVKIRARNENDIVRLALNENIEQEGKWFKRLLCVVKGATGKDPRVYMNGADWISVDDVLQDARKHYMENLFRPANVLAEKKLGIHGITACRQAGYKVFVYLGWFGHCERTGSGTYVFDKTESLMNRFWHHLNRRDQVRIVAQFRLGVHWLAVETGRFGTYIPRVDRICPLCSNEAGQGTIEDEWHVFQCVAYEELRKQHTHIFRDVRTPDEGDDAGFRNMMNPQDHVKTFWRVFANFLTQCKKHRSNMLAEIEARGT